MPDLKQIIRYCKAANGMSIAWSTMGSGPPLLICVMAGHLELTLHAAFVRPFHAELSRFHTLIRYDGLGTGLSDRNFDDVSIESAVKDVESVVDAARLDKFSMIAPNHGAQAAIVYCARHPEKVARLTIYGGYARGLMHRNPTPSQIAQREAVLAAMEAGWSEANPAFRWFNSLNTHPEATREEIGSLSEMQRAGFSGKFMVRMMRAQAEADVSEDAQQVRCPVLVLHARDDPRIPFEEGRRLASLFPDARFVPVNSPNNFILPSDPAFPGVMREILEFNAGDAEPPGANTAFVDLTPREREVLELIARGLDNLQIAAHLGLSEKTVRNHITPIFDKLAVENRSQAIVKAREAGLGIGKRPG